MTTDPSPSRKRIDASCRWPVVFFMVSAVFWLLAGSALAFMASYKMHDPEFLADSAWLTFGRVRPAHLNTMVYGWASMAGIGILLWLQARLSRVELPLPRLLVGAGVGWNVLITIGTIEILAGGGTSVEWLEFPFYVAVGLTMCFFVVSAASLLTFMRRRPGHVYVSQWYLLGSIFWFPFLYIGGNVMIHLGVAHGVAQGTANWWFAHNILGIWFTPIGLASAYYFIPKVIGRPVHSYYLSILGFWTLAIFYNWAGTHHLIGGPIPIWVQSVGIVASMMMFVPVITVAINHHMTMVGHFDKLRYSPTLRFVVFGAVSYTAVSVQGSLTALRFVQETTHFTHYTIAHAHLGMYAFVTMVFYGAIYYILPRLLNREWPSRRLIQVHFWSTAVGVILYWVGLTLGGIIQGRMMLDPGNAFLEIVEATIPYLQFRTVAAVILTVGHVAFAISIGLMIRPSAKDNTLRGPTLFEQPDKDADVQEVA